MARRRQTNIFSLSLLDCITCGFGALILFHMIVAARAGETFTDITDALQAECTNQIPSEAGSFIIAGKGGSPRLPGGYLPSLRLVE